MSKNLTIGIDLGIASCGWAVYNNDTKINEDQGVYLFEQAKSAQDRRANRSIRRRYNRTNYRELRLRRLLDDYNFNEQVKPDNRLIDIRIKGLNEKLDKQQIVNVLNFYIKQRGYIPFKEGRDGVEYHPIALREENKNKFPCEIQKQILEEEGKVRGIKNKFLWSDYKKEIKQILDTQAKFYTEIDQDFIDKYFAIYESKRHFWEGPGGCEENQITPFGRWKTVEEVREFKKSGRSVNSKLLFEELIADCNVYSGEKSAPIGNFYAQTFNLINDLTNLRFLTLPAEKYITYFKSLKDGTYKLNQSGIKFMLKSIISHYDLKSQAPAVKQITKLVGYDINDVVGFRTKDNKPEMHTYSFYKKVVNAIRSTQPQLIPFFQEHIDYFNDIIYILTIFPGIDAIKDQLTAYNNGDTDVPHRNQHCGLLTDESIEAISKIKTDDMQSYHAFSEKALKVYIKIMLREEANSSYVERNFENEIKPTRRYDLISNYPQDGKITTKYIDDIIANPQVKKSLRKAIYIINCLLDIYGDDIKCIAIESNKELLSSDAKKKYEKDALDNEKIRKEIKKDLEKSNRDVNEANILKLRLLKQTEHHCIYCNKDLSFEQVEIDHIIPLSISCDDSQANKVACCPKCNQAKGQRAPLEWISDGNGQKAFKELVNRYVKNLSEQKLNNLLFSGNTQDLRYQKRFVNRNLRDTSYATKELTNQIKLFLEANQDRKDIKVVTVPPKMTGMVRHIPDLKKDRSFHYHHAVDATIIAAFANTNIGQLATRIQNNPEDFWKSDSLDTLVDNKFIPINRICPEQTIAYLKTINYDSTRIKFEVKHKTQGPLGNANYNKVIKINNDYYKIEFLKCSNNNTTNIYEMDNKTLETIFSDNSEENKKSCNLLIKEKDHKLYELLKSIYEKYKDKTIIVKEKDKEVAKTINPFKHYCMDMYNLDSDDQFIPSLHGIRKTYKSPVVTKLKIRTKVTNPWLLNKKDIRLKDNNMIMIDSLSQAYTKIYYSPLEAKYLFMPIYMNMLKTKNDKIIENKDNEYYKLMWEEYVVSKTKHLENIVFVMNVQTNDYLRFTDKDEKFHEGLMKTFHKKNNSIEFKSNSHGSTKNFTSKAKNLEKIGYGKLGRKGLKL